MAVYEIIVSHTTEQGICALNHAIPASPRQCLTVTEGINIKFNLLGFVIPTERFKSFILTFLYNPTALTTEHSQVKDLEQEFKDVKSQSECLSTAANNVGDSRTKIMGGHTCMVPATTRSRAIATAPASARGRALLPALVSKRDESHHSTQGSQPRESHCHGSG